MMFYSKTTNSFYSKLVHGTNIPTDCVQLTDEQYLLLLEGQTSGKKITADSTGNPTLVDVVPDTSSLQAAERAWRDSELKRSDIELNKVQDSDPKSVGAVGDWRTYRKALRALPEHPLFPSIEARPVAPDA